YPPWKGTLGRSLKLQVRPSAEMSQVAAKPGWSARVLGSFRSRVSPTMWVTISSSPLATQGAQFSLPRLGTATVTLSPVLGVKLEPVLHAASKASRPPAPSRATAE